MYPFIAEMWALVFSLTSENCLKLMCSFGIGGVCLLVVIFVLNKFQYSNIGVKPDVDSPQFCDLPSCLRCNTNSVLRQNAMEVFRLNEGEDLRRMEAAICNNQVAEFNYLLYIDDLISRPTWSFDELPESYKADYAILKESIDLFVNDFHKFSVLRSPCGWSKIFLANQGKIMKENSCVSSATCSILDKCKNIITHCAFGYVFFSILHPNASIKEHNGPTNCRIRCHVSLQVPEEDEECEMDVAGNKVKWKDKGVTFFDDSLKHSVRYEGKKDSIDRVVLLIDFWHPGLTLAERRCIQKCYDAGNKI